MPESLSRRFGREPGTGKLETAINRLETAGKVLDGLGKFRKRTSGLSSLLPKSRSLPRRLPVNPIKRVLK